MTNPRVEELRISLRLSSYPLGQKVIAGVNCCLPNVDKAAHTFGVKVLFCITSLYKTQ